MTTDSKIADMQRKKISIRQGGGKQKIEEQHSKQKLTARERLELLLDQGSFVEIDAFVEHRSTNFNMPQVQAHGDGVITGYGTIQDRLVFVYAQDFTVIGGSLGEMHAKKICKVMDMAIEMGAPIIGLNDSGGARIQEGIDALKGYGEIFLRNTKASGVIPQISVIMGPCAGGAVYSPALTDFIFMVDGTSKMFITGPQVIKAATGEEVSADELGGAMAHNQKSGVAHFVYQDEKTCLENLRKFMGFLPSNNLEESPGNDITDDLNRLSSELNKIIPDEPNKVYDMKNIILEVLDNNDFIEVQPYFAQNIITGFGRLNGKTVGIIANQPKVLAGCLDIDASDKAARFVRFCDSFNIPIVTFTDVPGYLPGVSQEHGGIIRHGAKLLFAYSEATVPKINVIVRKAYGGAYIAMSSKHLGADIVLAWPTAEIAVMGPEGAANIVFRKEIEESQDPQTFRQTKIQEYRDEFANPYKAAARGYVDDIIEPEATRPRLINAIEMLASKRQSGLKKKHGNIPV
ncbi:MAG: carboxyl transferase domain-containing protein [Clostridia bacterium]|nr:carboxyl transferase domain-containing protein [Clostridia bacterium]